MFYSQEPEFEISPTFHVTFSKLNFGSLGTAVGSFILNLSRPFLSHFSFVYALFLFCLQNYNSQSPPALYQFSNNSIHNNHVVNNHNHSNIAQQHYDNREYESKPVVEMHDWNVILANTATTTASVVSYNHQNYLISNNSDNYDDNCDNYDLNALPLPPPPTELELDEQRMLFTSTSVLQPPTTNPNARSNYDPQDITDASNPVSIARKGAFNVAFSVSCSSC